MSSVNHRVLFHITMLSSDDPMAIQKANETYWRINNILEGGTQLPNIKKICDSCDGLNKNLEAYIRNKCLDLGKETTLFDPSLHKTNAIFNVIDDSERKNIRIILYPGNRGDIDDLNMHETTHNMIIQFDNQISNFKPTEAHVNPPSFYQVCNSAELALLYLEALLVDACMCHYLGVSDVAYHHDDKQHISAEKVLFLREIAQRDLTFLSENAQRLIKYVLPQLSEDTPYISFLSIFTIASLDIFDEDGQKSIHFTDYCKLWAEFQRWYYNKHGRLFSKNVKLQDPLATVFNRNKYQGQISPREIKEKIEELLQSSMPLRPNPLFGMEHRYAVIIIKRVPDTTLRIKQFQTLFSGQLHQSKWDIIYWGNIDRYNDVLSYLEIVPFMIEN